VKWDLKYWVFEQSFCIVNCDFQQIYYNTDFVELNCFYRKFNQSYITGVIIDFVGDGGI
jgi:hypothetical protein